MLSELAARHDGVRSTFDEASAVLGFDLWQVVAEGPEERLNQTAVTQPAMLAADIACWRLWRELCADQGIAQSIAKPSILAGHSLGEYAALVAAESIPFDEAIALVAARGEAMQDAVPPGQGAMAALIGLDDTAVAAVCEAAAQGEVVSPANFNAPGQVVIAGHAGAVDRACAAAREAGAKRAITLPVSVPSHCDLMREAAATLAPRLNALSIRAPSIPVLHNADVDSHEQADAIRDALARQLFSPVRWTETLKTLQQNGIGRMVECGPGRVLAGLARRGARGVSTAVLQAPDDFSQLMEQIQEDA